MLKMPWWKLEMRSQQEKTPIIGKDSGVFMGSDTSMEDGSVDDAGFDGSCDLPSTPRTVRPTHSVTNTPVVKSGPEQRAIQLIEECVENGNETIDLAGFNLTSITSAMIKPLHHLIRQTNIADSEPPSEHQFCAFTPSLQLFLSSNAITRIPRELFDLERLTVLSLRGNLITSIPPGASRLQDLREFNFSGNVIEILPWDLLQLYEDDCKIVALPNPLIRPRLSEDDVKAAYAQPRVEPQFNPLGADGPFTDRQSQGLADRVFRARFRARLQLHASPRVNPYHVDTLRLKLLSLRVSSDQTLRTYEGVRAEFRKLGILDLLNEIELRMLLAEGRHKMQKRRIEYEDAAPLTFVVASTVRKLNISSTCPPLDHDDSFVSFDTSQPSSDNDFTTQPPPTTGPGALSLLELALQSVSKHLFPAQQAVLIPDAPPRIQKALRSSLEGLENGHKTCSTCHRTFIIPWARWIEFWSVKPASSSQGLGHILPFERFACSQFCAQPSPPGTFRRRER
jgi:Leucine-rich repeat (LRR) protein